jgi:hypothetical protein
MEGVYAASISQRRFNFNMLLLSIFAGIAATLAGVGIYGVISYLVTQRTHGIGIRITLGAKSRDSIRYRIERGQGIQDYSYLSATIGSTRIARRAGM